MNNLLYIDQEQSDSGGAAYFMISLSYRPLFFSDCVLNIMF